MGLFYWKQDALLLITCMFTPWILLNLVVFLHKFQQLSLLYRTFIWSPICVFYILVFFILQSGLYSYENFIHIAHKVTLKEAMGYEEMKRPLPVESFKEKVTNILQFYLSCNLNVS
jgi:hypothetical protein